MTLRHTRFAPDAFQAEAFDRFGIRRPERLARAVAKRQAEYLAGRVCARAALSVHGHGRHDIASLPDRGPGWPVGMVGAITHSRDFAAALVARAEHWAGLGLDAEHLLTEARATRLQQEILTASELAWTTGFTPSQLAYFVTLVFSAKESLFKALYPLVGRRFYFHDARLTQWDERSGRLGFELLTSLNERWRAGAQVAGFYSEFAGQLLTVIAVPAMHEH